MARISVVMGVYNTRSEDLLRKSVQSIINQTFKDWEFIICNDGSTDNTLATLNEIKEQDPRIKILSYEPNRGLAYALNACIQEAEGEYIARQDDDDQSKPDRLMKQLTFFEQHPSYHIVGTCALIYDDGGVWGEYQVAEKPEKTDFLWNSPFIHPVTMMKKAALQAVGGYRVAKETYRCQDYDLFMRMYAMGMKGYNIQENLYEYRMVNTPNMKYRPMKHRVDEAIVRYKGFHQLHMRIRGIPYILKPVLIGLIPTKLFSRIRSKQYKIADGTYE